MNKSKGGRNYVYFENCYKEDNYPYIPIPIECGFKEYDRANKLDRDGIIGIHDISESKDYVKGYCLAKDLNKVSRRLKLKYNLTGETGNTNLDWLHDGLMDEFGDFEVEKSSRLGIVRDIRDKRIHRVIHFIMDNIDQYCGYFIKSDCDYEWLYSLYDDAKDGIVDSHYKLEN